MWASLAIFRASSTVSAGCPADDSDCLLLQPPIMAMVESRANALTLRRFRRGISSFLQCCPFDAAPLHDGFSLTCPNCKTVFALQRDDRPTPVCATAGF